MKLHWVELENWRQHIKTRIDFAADATVIYGPNEKGKSAVLEALSRGFFDKPNSHNKDIKHIKPLTASGNVTSTVRIEFTLNKSRYRVEKNFNLREGTSLYKIDNGKPILENQDVSADEQLRQLLEADLPSKGKISKPSQWGAFQWLWAPQDNRELPNNKEGDPTTALHLKTKDNGTLLVTLKFQAIQDRILSHYAEYFYKKGNINKNSPIKNIKKEIQTLQIAKDELKSEIKIVDDKK